MDILRKSLDSITAEDIEDFCTHHPEENAQLEFKCQVPDEKAEKEPWSASNTKLSKPAKKKILRAIVALANSYGGHLILGIKDDGQDKADSPTPIPACSQLEKILEDVLRDSVDPQIVGIEMRTVPFPAGSDEGILIIKVPQSRLRPHRSNADKEVYIRIVKSSFAVSMRDIRERILDSRSALERVEAILDSRAIKVRPKYGEVEPTAAVRITALPTGGDVFLKHPYEYNGQLVYMKDIQVDTGMGLHSLFPPFGGGGSTPFQPRLRGAVKLYKAASGIVFFDLPSYPIYREEVHENGLVELVYTAISNDYVDEQINQFNLLAQSAHVLRQVHKVRELAGVPGAEYVIEVQILYWPLPDGKPQSSRSPFANTGSFTLPRITFYGPDLDVPLREIYDDIQNLLGLPHLTTFEVKW